MSAEFDDSLPAAPSGRVNVHWQSNGAGQISANTLDYSDAANITSGTLSAARLPSPSATTLGGVESIAAVSHQFLTSISTSGVPAQAALVAADIPNIAESQVTNLTTDLSAKAPLASPAFTGTPTAPTPTAADNSTKLATTAYVDSAVSAVGGGTVTSVSATVPSDFSVSVTNPTTTPAIAITGGPTKSAIQQEAYTYAADSGAANGYAVTLSPSPTLVAGSEVVFKAANANTGASTLAVNGGTAIAIKKNGNSAALAAGDIAAGQIITARYDGTVFQISVPGSGVVTSLTTTGTSGPATLSAGVLNVPQYGASSLPAYIQPSTAVPTVASLTAVNQSLSTAVDSAAGIYMYQPVGSANTFFALLQSAPSTPWTFTAALNMQLFGNNYNFAGVVFSDGTKFQYCGPVYNSASGGLLWSSSKWNSASSFNVDYTTAIKFPLLAPCPILWLRLRDDGTNRIFYYSYDGQNFKQFFSVARTDFLTATSLGICLGINTGGMDIAMTCSSWKVS